MVTKPRAHYTRGLARRSLVIAAAVDVIAEHGLEGVTHRAVASRAGVPLSTTSYFFSSMDDLIGAAVTQIADEVLAAVRTLVDEAATQGPGLPMEDYIERLVDVVAAPRERQIAVQFEAYLGTTRRPELAEPVRRILEAYEHAAEMVLTSLGASEPHRAARELVALLDGFALQRIAFPRADDVQALQDAVRSFSVAHLGRIPGKS